MPREPAGKLFHIAVVLTDAEGHQDAEVRTAQARNAAEAGVRVGIEICLEYGEARKVSSAKVL